MTAKKPSKAQSAPMKTSGIKPEKPVALTLKIDNQTFIRLSTLRARDRKTAQDILTEALEAYLKRAGV